MVVTCDDCVVFPPPPPVRLFIATVVFATVWRHRHNQPRTAHRRRDETTVRECVCVALCASLSLSVVRCSSFLSLFLCLLIGCRLFVWSVFLCLLDTFDLAHSTQSLKTACTSHAQHARAQLPKGGRTHTIYQSDSIRVERRKLVRPSPG